MVDVISIFMTKSGPPDKNSNCDWILLPFLCIFYKIAKQSEMFPYSMFASSSIYLELAPQKWGSK